RVEHMVLVRQADGGESVPQLAEFPARVGEAGLVPEDSDVALHQLLHFDPHAREGLLPSLATHEAVEDASLLPPEGFSRRGAAGIRDPLLRVLGRGEAAPLAEHEALAQAVRPEAVRAVDRDARGLADRVQARERRLPGRVRGHPAHDVMLARTHGDRLADRIEAHVLLPAFAGTRPVVGGWWHAGWTWTLSMSSSPPPALWARAMPSPVLMKPFVVNSYTRPHPPVARIVAFPLIATRRPPRRSIAMTPAQTPPSTMRLVTKYS